MVVGGVGVAGEKSRVKIKTGTACRAYDLVRQKRWLPNEKGKVSYPYLIPHSDHVLITEQCDAWGIMQTHSNRWQDFQVARVLDESIIIVIVVTG